MKQTTPRSVLLTAPCLTVIGGIGTHVSQLMSSPLRLKFRLTHFSAGAGGRIETPLQRALRQATTPLAWLRCLRRERWSVVHINTVLDRNALVRDAVLMILARMTSSPVVWQVHGGAEPRTFCKGALSMRLLKALLKLADEVVVITRADEVAYREIVGSARLVRIVNSIDATACACEERRSSAERVLKIAFLGRLIATKGVLEAVDAIAEARRMGVPVHLSIAGTGPAAADVLRRIHQRGVERDVCLLGVVEGVRKQCLLAESDLFLLPTYHLERMPYALLEAMAAGAVPIVCAAGDIGEVVIPGRHGFIIEPRRPDLIAQTIVEIAADRERLKELSLACMARVRELYSLERMADEFRALYERVLEA